MIDPAKIERELAYIRSFMSDTGVLPDRIEEEFCKVLMGDQTVDELITKVVTGDL